MTDEQALKAILEAADTALQHASPPAMEERARALVNALNKRLRPVKLEVRMNGLKSCKLYLVKLGKSGRMTRCVAEREVPFELSAVVDALVDLCAIVPAHRSSTSGYSGLGSGSGLERGSGPDSELD